MVSARQGGTVVATDAQSAYALLRLRLGEAQLEGLPQFAVDALARDILAQTTLYRRGSMGVQKVYPSDLDVVDYVRAASPTYPDMFLYALRVEVVIAGRPGEPTGRTICQGVFTTGSLSPTVVCDPVTFGK